MARLPLLAAQHTSELRGLLDCRGIVTYLTVFTATVLLLYNAYTVRQLQYSLQQNQLELVQLGDKAAAQQRTVSRELSMATEQLKAMQSTSSAGASIRQQLHQPGEPRGLYMGDGVVFCYVQPLGLAMLLEGADVGITPHLCRGLGWEPDISAVFQRLVRMGDYVLDVGANVGYFTLMFSSIVGEGGRVRAFEANPRVHHLTASTVELQGLAHRTQVLNRAVYSKDGTTVKISTSRDRILNNRVVEGGGAIEGNQVHMADVQTTTLDTATKDWGRLDFVKIDVEGAEGHAFKGMQGLLQRFPDVVVVMEVNTARMGVKEAEVFYKEIQAVFPELRMIDGDKIRKTTADEVLANVSGDVLLVLSRGKRQLI